MQKEKENVSMGMKRKCPRFSNEIQFAVASAFSGTVKRKLRLVDGIE